MRITIAAIRIVLPLPVRPDPLEGCTGPVGSTPLLLILSYRGGGAIYNGIHAFSDYLDGDAGLAH
jgi:hypothetical protein